MADINIRGIDENLRARATAKAKLEGTFLKNVIVEFLEQYVEEQPRKDHGKQK